MAKFEGTYNEFKTFIGGYCRNKVRQITTQEKAKHKRICMHCKKEAELESAHVRGFEREAIIEFILDGKFKIAPEKYSVDLHEFEKLFVEIHEPIDEHFYFLCQSCHRKYDRGEFDINTESVVQKEEDETVKPVVPPTPSVSPLCSDNTGKWHRFEGESIQNYVKRLIRKLEDNKMLTPQLIVHLQNLDYCKRNFGINYPLFESNASKIKPAGRLRYWVNKIAGFYVCKEWWKENFSLYEYKLHKWIDSIPQLNRTQL